MKMYCDTHGTDMKQVKSIYVCDACSRERAEEENYYRTYREMMLNNVSTCFTGHRPNKLYGYDPMVKGNKQMLLHLRSVIEDHIQNKNVDTFITGMALGIDMWAARIVLALKNKYPHIKLTCAIPCKNQSRKWIQDSVKEWNQITQKADTMYYVSDEEYTAWCMQKRNEWMVNNSDYVIAVWDGTSGGTKNCVDYAKKKEKIITYINPKEFTIK